MISAFREPTGDVVESPTSSWIREMLRRDDSYWAHGSQDACITVQSPSSSVDLYILRITEGIHLWMPAHRDMWIALPPDLAACEFDDLVEFELADRTWLPRVFFLSVNLASRAVDGVLRTASRTEDVLWARRTELHWNSDDQDDYYA